MKTKEQIQAALDEIKAVCDKHGVVLMGTAYGESIYGEILISTSEEIKWMNPEERGWNSIYEIKDSLYTDAIGTLEAKE